MGTQVYLFAQNAVHGPYEYDQILDGVRQGQITPQHVMSYDAQQWFPASSVWPQLLEQAGIVAAQAPPPLPTANAAPGIAAARAAPADPAPVIQVRTKQKKEEETSPDWTPWDEWWGKIVAAPLLWGFAAWLYYAIGNMDAEGGRVKVYWLVAAAYKMGGKWGAVGLCTVAGLLFLWWGIVQFNAPEKKEPR
jgi:hypothetical protein